jgi:hypothetical protein
VVEKIRLASGLHWLQNFEGSVCFITFQGFLNLAEKRVEIGKSHFVPPGVSRFSLEAPELKPYCPGLQTPIMRGLGKSEGSETISASGDAIVDETE